MRRHGRCAQDSILIQEDSQGPHQQGEFGAFCRGLAALRHWIAGRQADHLGHLDRQQGADHPLEIRLGNDGGLFAVG